MTSAATPWSHFPPGSPANPVIIEDVNFKLNGPDQSGDFWPVGTITEQHPSPAVHVVGPAQFLVPEPSSLTLLALGVIGAWAARRRRGRGAV